MKGTEKYKSSISAVHTHLVNGNHSWKMVLGVLLLFPLSTSLLQVHAAGENNHPHFDKYYRSAGETAVSPAEDFSFTAELYAIDTEDGRIEINETSDVDEAIRTINIGPNATSNVVSFEGGMKEEIQPAKFYPPSIRKFTLPGTYYYKVQEVQGNTAGITYDVDQRIICRWKVRLFSTE